MWTLIFISVALWTIGFTWVGLAGWPEHHRMLVLAVPNLIVIGIALQTSKSCRWIPFVSTAAPHGLSWIRAVNLFAIGLAVQALVEIVFGHTKIREVQSASVLVMQLLVLALIGPLAEELLFRFSMLQRAIDRFGVPIGFTLSCVMFALLHPGLHGFVSALVCALITSLIAMSYKRVLEPTLYHSGANVTGMLLQD